MFIVSAISSFETSSYELMSALTPNIECYPALNQPNCQQMKLGLIAVSRETYEREHRFGLGKNKANCHGRVVRPRGRRASPLAKECRARTHDPRSGWGAGSTRKHPGGRTRKTKPIRRRPESTLTVVEQGVMAERRGLPRGENKANLPVQGPLAVPPEKKGRHGACLYEAASGAGLRPGFRI
jgi:hypothetical protein